MFGEHFGAKHFSVNAFFPQETNKMYVKSEKNEKSDFWHFGTEITRKCLTL